MYTLEELNSGYSVLTGARLSDGYKLLKDGQLVALLIRSQEGSWTIIERRANHESNC